MRTDFCQENGELRMYKVGILTFHCADNFGAMLQAYGLKTYLRERGIAADIVPYEPPFMTGRHWWIPYIPMKCFLNTLYLGWIGWKRNLKLGTIFFERRTNMTRFREKYLTGEGKKRLFFLWQFRKLQYQYYIVGSDQIWNPDITLGLRRAYFGAFENKNKKKVIAYAASMGKASVAEQYSEEFSDLLKSLDHISVREKAAIPYISQFYRGDVCAVPDPVFLLRKDDWKKIEKLPDNAGYIFVYITEKNDRLFRYAGELAKKKGLGIIRIKGGTDIAGINIVTDDTAGPSEFLGYLHKADYVITNSFHGATFSIVFEKQFVVFQHSSVGARISDVLEFSGLECRLYQEEGFQIDSEIAWDSVEKRIKEKAASAEKFLMRCLR